MRNRGDVDSVEVFDRDGLLRCEIFATGGETSNALRQLAHWYLRNQYGYGLRADDLEDPEIAERRRMETLRARMLEYENDSVRAGYLDQLIAIIQAGPRPEDAGQYRSDQHYFTRNNEQCLMLVNDELGAGSARAWTNGDPGDPNQMVFTPEVQARLDADNARIAAVPPAQSGGAADPFFFPNAAGH